MGGAVLFVPRPAARFPERTCVIRDQTPGGKSSRERRRTSEWGAERCREELAFASVIRSRFDGLEGNRLRSAAEALHDQRHREGEGWARNSYFDPSPTIRLRLAAG